MKANILLNYNDEVQEEIETKMAAKDKVGA